MPYVVTCKDPSRISIMSYVEGPVVRTSITMYIYICIHMELSAPSDVYES